MKVSLKVIKVEFVRAVLVRKEGLTDEQSSSLIKTEKLTIKETNMPHSMANISRKFPELNISQLLASSYLCKGGDIYIFLLFSPSLPQWR